ncbi:MAG TPA: DNA primase [Clostridiaceae bacterium]|nr:DNA primase [Clostridiaceae bacterium]
MYGYFSEEVIEEIKLRNDIVDVVSEYVKIEKKGKDFFGLCPFHKEKTPSFSVVPSKQIFYCFGCGKGGNVIHFIMNAENLDYVEAVRLLAERANIQIAEVESREEKLKAKLRQEILNINVEAARFFFENLNSAQGEKAKKYLEKRNIQEHIVRRFGLGYSPEEWDKLFLFLENKKFSKESIVKSGLVLKNRKGGYYDRFRGRLMFPIFDLRGNVIGFGGRVLDSSMPKYMNSPETIVYNKGRNLYALNFARKSNEKSIIMVEGYMDAISLHQHGITNTVASLGTALTETQGRLLKKYADEVIVAFDSDTAGQAATLRSLELLDSIGCNVKILTLPQGKDPDEYIRSNGAEEFRKLVKNSLSVVEFRIKTIKKETDTETTEGKIKFLDMAAEVLSKIDNNIEKEMYVKKIASEYGISEESILLEIDKKIRAKNYRKLAVRTNNNVRNIIQKKSLDKMAEKQIQDERIFLVLLCIDNGLFRNLRDRININLFTDEQNKRIAEIVFSRLENEREITPDELLDIAGVDLAHIFAEIISELSHCDDIYKAIMGKITSMEMYHIKNRQKQIVSVLENQTGLTEGDVEKLKQELLQLTLLIKNRKNK